MHLSTNFSLWEFERSQTASRHKIDNKSPLEVINELQNLVEHVLQPLRNYVNRPINISSGYRSEKLNSMIGGSSKSQHIKGQAADIECFGMGNLELFDIIKKNFDYDQLILEFHKVDYPNSGWVHISFNLGNNRFQDFSIG